MELITWLAGLPFVSWYSTELSVTDVPSRYCWHVVPVMAICGPLRKLHCVLPESAGQVTAEPSHFSATSQSPLTVRHVVPVVATPFAGTSALVLVQFSAM